MRLLLVVLLLAIVPALAQAQETPPEANETPAEATPAAPAAVEIFLEGTDKGGFAFYVVGNPQKNPTITVAPGAQVTIHLKSTGGFHNVQVTGQKASPFVDAGEETTITFTAPTTPGTLEYWCVPHKASGMIGKIVVGSAPAPAEGGGDVGGGEILGETIEVPGCPGSKIPAPIAQGVAGAPTMEDYKAKCAGAQTQGEEKPDPYKNTDYVLPVSFALIGLGVLAVVWVHKSYKP